MADINQKAAMVETIILCNNQLGEGPLWHPQEKALYWVDIADVPRVFRFQPDGARLHVYPVGVAVTALARRKAGGFIAATRAGLAYWSPVNELQLFSNPEADDPFTRLNDGAADRQGRFWFGSMKVGAQSSSLFRCDPGGQVQRVDSGFIISNGIGWSPDGATMYFTDSFQHAIFAYDFDAPSGGISSRRVFADTSSEAGVPDGLAVDSQGGVWSVFCRGWKIIRYTPEGKKDIEIPLPVECPTSCCFAGDALDQMYITSSWGLVDQEKRKSQPLAGSLFRLRMGFHGIAEPAYLG
jgi:sugar lactone lactonase YvrE